MRPWRGEWTGTVKDLMDVFYDVTWLCWRGDKDQTRKLIVNR